MGNLFVNNRVYISGEKSAPLAGGRSLVSLSSTRFEGIATETSPFPLGQTVITRNAKNVLNPQDVQACLDRHAKGDWGEVAWVGRSVEEEMTPHPASPGVPGEEEDGAADCAGRCAGVGRAGRCAGATRPGSVGCARSRTFSTAA
jgi:hypothetical protein